MLAGRVRLELRSCKELVDPVGAREQRMHVAMVVQNRELTCNCWSCAAQQCHGMSNLRRA